VFGLTTLSDLLGGMKGWFPMYKNAGVDSFEHCRFFAANAYIGILLLGVDD